ncbi:MAG: hypothetical protein CL723_02315 [Chloroflexi bacterium]|jgi:mono/diheme cytochrome c family protein|nr:hypothetical protein [Chloroflexota bacterium]|tara:strand:- start:889 stop:1563 length:675 start_codon:yes stop_codon:yes gene_type:complete
MGMTSYLSKRYIPLLLFISVLFLTACTGNIKTGELNILGETDILGMPAIPKSGSHAIMIFSEMHYQPSFKSQEIPRIMPNPEAVPMNGKEINRTPEEYKSLNIPSQYNANELYSQGSLLYAENCVFCHGDNLDGKGKYRDYVNIKSDAGKVINKGAYPANLLSDKTAKSTDGEIYAFISKGSRTGLAQYSNNLSISSGMLAYDSILTEQERWALVSYIRRIQGK